MEKGPTTISKEVKEHRINKVFVCNYAYTSSYCKVCLKSKECKIKVLSQGVKGECAEYEPFIWEIS